MGTRLCKENHLSDVTWALAKNCPEFQKIFAEFFGFGFNPNLRTEITREDSIGKRNRVDILIENGDTVFVVENKIYGKDCHIEQYGRVKKVHDKSVGKLGLITNYRIDERLGVKSRNYNFTDPRTWEEFTQCLEGNLRSGVVSSEWEEVIAGYVEYVKGACSIMKIKEIRFDSITSLVYFNRLVKKTILQFQSEKFDCQILPASRAFGEHWSGQYFTLDRKGGGLHICPFFGVDFLDEPPAICFSFENERAWCQEIYTKLKGSEKKGDFFNIYSDKNEATFELNEEKYKQFIQSPLDRQEALLKEFFGRMVDEVSHYF